MANKGEIMTTTRTNPVAIVTGAGQGIGKGIARYLLEKGWRVAMGELDREALFYLQSRGIGEEEARSLLIYAFASEFIERIGFSPVRKDLEKILINRLPHGEIIRQAM